MSKKVVLDPGHGVETAGKCSPDGTYREHAFALDLAKRLKLILERHGVEVTLTRTDEHDISLAERVKISNAITDLDLFVSLHSNAAGSGGAWMSPRGYGVYTSAAGAAAGRNIAANKLIGRAREAGIGLHGSGLHHNGSLYVLKNTTAPAVLIEHLFHDNREDVALLKDSAFRDKLAEADAKGILDYLGIAWQSAAADSAASPADGYTKIMGSAVVTAAQMRAYLKGVNPSVPQSVLDMLPLYLSEGEAEGVRGDVAFAQSCLETGNFGFAGSAVTLDQNNFCGMGVTANGLKGNSFATPQLGIRAQIQHLKAYACIEPLKNALVDPRFQYVTRGCAEYVEWLGQKENPSGKGWASGTGYGALILTILRKAAETKTVDSDAGAEAFAPYLVKVDVTDLRIRSGPGTGYAIKGYTGKGVFTIVAESAGQGSAKGWGKLKSGTGWIALDYAARYN